MFKYFPFLYNNFIANHFPKNSNKLKSIHWPDCDFRRRFEDNITRDMNSFFRRLGSELLKYQLTSVLFIVCAVNRTKLLKELSCTLHKMAVYTNEVFSVWEKLALCQDRCSSVQFPARGTFVRWLRNTPFTAHLLHTPAPNTLFLYAPDNILTATHLPYWLPFSQIKLLITHESFSHSPLFPQETAGFLELRSQKYSAEKFCFYIFIVFFFFCRIVLFLQLLHPVLLAIIQ